MRKWVIADPESLREMCIKNNWFTHGTIEQYNKLFEINRIENGYTTYTASDIALVIWLCSGDVSRDEIFGKLVEAQKVTNIAEEWEKLYEKYPKDRENMSEEEEENYVKDCFDLYERFGFRREFTATSDELRKYDGQPFAVVSRVPIFRGPDGAGREGADLECLPMWNIQFEDGRETAAFPDEICVAEIQQ